MRFGKIDSYILFGGGQVLADVSLKLKKMAQPVVVFSDDRHLAETGYADGLTLENFLKQQGIEYYNSANIGKDKNVDKFITASVLGISFGAAWIFKQEFIDKFNGRLINFHPTNLPKNRGGGGFSWMILNSENQGRNLLHFIDAGIDTGDIIKQKNYALTDDLRLPKDYYVYSERLHSLFFDEFLAEVAANNDFTLLKQDEKVSSYYPRISTLKNGLINWSMTGQQIALFISAFDDPYPGASTFLGDKKVILKDCQLLPAEENYHPFTSGLVIRKDATGLFVASTGRLLLIKRVMDENNQEITNQIQLGERFYTPSTELDKAMSFRAIYNAKGLKNEI
ncbi:MAG: formyltransferase family protein [Candidatus Komeilibacteria bacterium]|nr:formyltransferase family protein [Candidatus Komeilibacteria bacterium]